MFSLVNLLLECVIAPFMYLMLLVHVPPIRDCNASLIPLVPRYQIKVKIKIKRLKKIEFLTSLNVLELRPYR